jgi:hypothetical protein
MTNVEAVVTLRINGRITEAECSLCHERIFVDGGEASIQEQEVKLREAVKRHAWKWHSEK